MEFSTDLLILIDHADGIIACLVWFSCFNGNIDGIKWRSLDSSEKMFDSSLNMICDN